MTNPVKPRVVGVATSGYPTNCLFADPSVEGGPYGLIFLHLMSDGTVLWGDSDAPHSAVPPAPSAPSAKSGETS